jgi:hypothetical membrane protein
MRVTHLAKERGQSPLSDVLKEAPPPWIAVLAWAGIAGPILFTATFIGQEIFRIDEYSPVQETVSALEAGPNGWVQQVNFVVFGLLTIAFAVGLRLGLRRTRQGIVGTTLLTVSGLGLLLAAILPLREDAAGVTYDPGGHFVAGVMFFMTSAVALIVVSRGLARDPAWENLATYTLVAGEIALAGFFVFGFLVVPDDAPLHEWAGVAQRALILCVLFPCRVVLAVRLLQVARGHRGAARLGLVDQPPELVDRSSTWGSSSSTTPYSSSTT